MGGFVSEGPAGQGLESALKVAWSEYCQNLMGKVLFMDVGKAGNMALNMLKLWLFKQSVV